MNRVMQPAISLMCAIAAIACVLIGSTAVLAGGSPRTIRIVYTNDTMGYIEPCGCGGRYLGGFARRSTMLSRLVKENPNVVVVDSGNASSMAANVGIIASFMAGMRYDAVGIGASETYYPDEFFRQADKCGLRVVDTARPESKSVATYLIKMVDGVNVGVVSYGRDIAGPDAPPQSKQAFYGAYKAARDKSDLLVLLDQGGIAGKGWLDSNADGLGAPDIVIGGLANIVLTKERIVGRTHIMPSSMQGKQVGVIDVEVAADRTATMTPRLVQIDKETPEDEAIKKQIEDFTQKLKSLATLSPSLLNFGSVKKGTKKEEYVTLTPKGSAGLTIKGASSTSEHVTAPDWARSPDGSYKIRIVIDGGNTTGRVLETVSFTMDLPGEPTLNLRVFGNVVDE